MLFTIFTLLSRTLVKILETPSTITEVYSDGLLVSKTKDHAEIDVPELIQGKKEIESLHPGKKVFVLTENEGFYSITKEARKLSASAEYSSHIGAVAVLINYLPTRFIAELYLKINKPSVLTKIFTDRDTAMKWLEQQMPAAGKATGNTRCTASI